MEVTFPEKLEFLFQPARYKVAYGGRGSAKSWSCARALLILAKIKKLRIGCFREFQNSITDSVYETLQKQAERMGIDKEFDFQKTSISHKITGTEFIFKGLRHNIQTVKSMEGVDIAWVEEAHTVSYTSWETLIPTMRGRTADDPLGAGGPFGQGPEIWVSFNPELDDDETYKRFVLNPPNKFDSKGKIYSYIEKVNYSDNPWFPETLEEERVQLKEKDPDAYLTVWEGNTRQTLNGSIYAEEIKKATLEGRIGKVPYDPSRPVNTFWDLGHSDKTAIVFVQTVGMEFNIIDYYEDSLKKMPFYIGVLQEKGYNYGTHYLPHDGSAETLSNVTPEKQLKANKSWTVKIVERPSRKYVGINAVRSIFDLINWDENNTNQLMQCLRRHCYKINEDTGAFSREPEHDTPWSHGCDAIQTLALSMKSETAAKKKQTKPDTRPNVIPIHGSTGWML